MTCLARAAAVDCGQIEASIMITEPILRKHWRNATDDVITVFSATCEDIFAAFGLNTPIRVAHFMGQISAETGDASLAGMRESGAYSAARAFQIFGVGHHSAALTMSECKKICSLPVAQRGPVLFERVYGLGNPKMAKMLGNTKKGDGWLFRGWGFLQTTGRAAWEKYFDMAAKIMPLDPSLRENGPDERFNADMIKLSVIMSVAEFCQPRILRAADKDDIPTVTRGVNGGLNGLHDRQLDTAEWKRDPVALAIEKTNGFKTTLVTSGHDVPMAVFPAGTIKIGDRGNRVKTLQQLLRSKNYNPGTIDGIFGDGTRAAILDFQQAHSMPTTGYWTPADRDAADEEGTDLPISPSRANATEEIVQADDSDAPMKPVLDSVDLSKKIAIGGGLATTAAKAASDTTATPTDAGSILDLAQGHLDKVQSISEQATSLWHLLQPFVGYLIPVSVVAAIIVALNWTKAKALFAHQNRDAI
jgi:predicted chitinase